MVPSQQAIINAVLGGDVEAFSELIRAHQARIRLICITFLGNSTEADDAAQDVFIKAFQNLHTFKGESSFETWLIRIADYHCLDLLRKKSRQRTESLEALLETRGETFQALLQQDPNADTPYTPDQLDLLGRLMSALPEDDRMILILREVEELSYEDIALRLHCSLDAVKGRLKRARQALLAKCGSFLQTNPSTFPAP